MAELAEKIVVDSVDDDTEIARRRFLFNSKVVRQNRNGEFKIDWRKASLDNEFAQTIDSFASIQKLVAELEEEADPND